MEYLMTYGWAILVIAIIVSLLFALGLFSGGAGTSSRCTPQSGFSCTNPSYGTNGISATISQDSGQYYLGAWVFVASSSEHISSSGLPVNFSASSANNMLYIGQLGPSQSTTFYYTNAKAGAIPTANVPVGYPFTGDVWLGYCTTPGCDSPTSFAKVGTINVKNSGIGFSGGSSTTISVTSTSTSSTSTSTTSTSSTIHYAAITLTNSQSSSTGTDFQQMINITSSTCSSCAAYENLNLSNVEFTTGPANTGTVLYAWIENGTSNTAAKTTVWVNLGSNTITASGAQTIYMNFLPMSSNAPVTSGYTGYAPQKYCAAANCMQTAYGQYDNGPRVFSFYDDFSGTSLNATKWPTSYGAVTINNMLRLNYNQGGTSSAVISELISNPQILEYAVAPGTILSNDQGSGIGSSQGSWDFIYNGYGFENRGFYTDLRLKVQTNGASNYILSTGSDTATVGTVFSLMWPATGTESIWENYVQQGSTQTDSSQTYLSSNHVILENYGGNNDVLTAYWVRTRIFPPNGQMPSANFGSIV